MTITQPTVLVLGAGASQPYGFPLGGQLRDRVCAMAQDFRLAVVLKQYGFDADHVQAFSDAITHTGYTSIDSFLEAEPDYIEIGKYFIAFALLPFEQPKALFPPKVKSKTHWYEYLVNCLDIGAADFKRNHLSIITFNYDRSLEHYLVTVIASRTGASPRHAAALARQIPIVHVHGLMGNYPGLGKDSIAYGDGGNVDGTIERAAAGIRVISEAGDDLSTFREAGRLVSAAERVYFLGFGFADASMERLAEFTTVAPGLVSATSKGITDGRWRYVTQTYFSGSWHTKRFRKSVIDFLRSDAALTSEP